MLSGTTIGESLPPEASQEKKSAPANSPLARFLDAHGLQSARKCRSNKAPGEAHQSHPREDSLLLREWVAGAHGVDVSDVMITSGSQQALHLLANALIDPGSKVLVEAPTNLAALRAFSVYAPTFAEVPTDDQGLQPMWLTEDLAANARFLYTMPEFQNPTGRRLPLERRRGLVTLAHAHGVPLIEDGSYAELRYRGASLPTLQSQNPDGVIYIGSWSKLPALRLPLGYMIVPKSFHASFVRAKQALKLHTPRSSQDVAYHLLKSGVLQNQIDATRNRYHRQCSLTLEALSRHMPLGVRWTAPEGGMFIWIELPRSIDADFLLRSHTAKGVAFAPGAPFFFRSPKANTMRLKFTSIAPEKIEDTVGRIGRLIATST
jgi:2-aminoadipate transaminase